MAKVKRETREHWLAINCGENKVYKPQFVAMLQNPDTGRLPTRFLPGATHNPMQMKDFGALKANRRK